MVSTSWHAQYVLSTRNHAGENEALGLSLDPSAKIGFLQLHLQNAEILTKYAVSIVLYGQSL